MTGVPSAFSTPLERPSSRVRPTTAGGRTLQENAIPLLEGNRTIPVLFWRAAANTVEECPGRIVLAAGCRCGPRFLAAPDIIGDAACGAYPAAQLTRRTVGLSSRRAYGFTRARVYCPKGTLPATGHPQIWQRPTSAIVDPAKLAVRGLMCQPPSHCGEREAPPELRSCFSFLSPDAWSRSTPTSHSRSRWNSSRRRSRSAASPV